MYKRQEEHDDHGDEDHDDEDHDDEDHEGEEHEEESYQDLENSVISWKNRILFTNKSEIELTFGYSNNKRKEFGHHDEEEHDDHGDEDHDDEDHDDEDHDEHEGEAHIDMDLKTTTVDMKYLFPKTENSEFVLGTSIMLFFLISMRPAEMIRSKSISGERPICFRLTNIHL